jgi:hypothetical protein
MSPTTLGSSWQKTVIEHLEMSGFKIDEGEKIMRKRDRGRGW